MFWRGRPQRRVSHVESRVAPVRGINDVDPLAATDTGYALNIVNMLAANNALVTRAGTRVWVENIGYPVETLIPYASTSGGNKLFAATRGGIFDVSDTTDTPTLVHPLTNGRCSFTQFSNAAGTFIVIANGVDPACFYDGVSWVSMSQSSAPAAIGEISGVSPAQFGSVIAFKNRLWFTEVDTMTAWYLPTGQLGGEARPFYFGGVFGRGGSIFELATWSFDSGSGMDDNLLVRSTVGEVAVYQGTDPNSAETWGLSSVFFVADAIGKRSSADLGGDCVMLTRAGIVPISKIVQGIATESLYESALSRNISRTLGDIVTDANALPSSWELHNVPELPALVLVIPETAATAARQFVMNIITGAWSEFDLPANCLGVYQNQVYIGTVDGRVLLHSKLERSLDNVARDGTGGQPITAEYLTAFDYFGDQTAIKHFKLARPILQSRNEPATQLSLAVDFDLGLGDIYQTPILADADPARWDTARWDAARWAESRVIYRPWSGVLGIGFCAAMRLRITVVEQTSVVAYEIVFETGTSI